MLCVLSVTVMIVMLTQTGGQKTGKFIPPEFDKTAAQGEPDVPENLGWTEVSQAGMSFSAKICGNVVIENGKADIYFKSNEDNEVWLKLRVLDAEGNVLGETGLIKPGEYVKSVTFDTLPQNEEKIQMKLMSYEPETYYSMGAVVLNTTARIGG